MFRFSFAIIALRALIPASAWAQVLYGSIVGNVNDKSGAAAPDAQVTRRSAAADPDATSGHT